MSRVLFIRHAETEMAGRFCGHSDPELNAQGRHAAPRVDPACSPRSRSIPSIAATCAAPALPRRRSPLFERYRGCCGRHCGRLISGTGKVCAGSRLNKWIRNTRGSGSRAIPIFPHPRERAFRPSRHASLRRWIIFSRTTAVRSQWSRMEACCAWSCGICAVALMRKHGSKLERTVASCAMSEAKGEKE